jgi:hypothetical protein
MRQRELFEPEPPPKVGSEKLDFTISLKDGSEVSVHFDRYYFVFSAHIEFRGNAISETGYRSYFPNNGAFINDSDDVVIEKIKEIAEFLREETIKEIAKESRRKGRKKLKVEVQK